MDGDCRPPVPHSRTRGWCWPFRYEREQLMSQTDLRGYFSPADPATRVFMIFGLQGQERKYRAALLFSTIDKLDEFMAVHHIKRYGIVSPENTREFILTMRFAGLYIAVDPHREGDGWSFSQVLLDEPAGVG